jgi:hypothetical protein
MFKGYKYIRETESKALETQILGKIKDKNKN